MQEKNQSRELGPLVATYGPSRSFVGAGRALCAVFVVIGVLPLWLFSRIGHDGAKFDGDPNLLLATGVGLIVFGIVFERVISMMARRHVTVHVHENAMRAVSRGRDQVDFHEDIEDIYLVSTGLFGWRATPSSPWVIIDNRISKMAQLRQHLLGYQLAQRGERLWKQLHTQGRVTFHLVPDGAAKRQIWVNTRNVDHPVTDITLTPRELTIAGKTVAIARLRKMDRSIWHERVQFVDVDGNVIYETVSNAVLSLDLLLALIEELQRPA